jgi:transcriptional regulator with XRE-family HTH domain
MSADEWKRLAQLSGTSVAYLNQMALGFRRPSVAMAERIEAAVPKVSPSLGLTKESLIFSPLRNENTEA